MNINNEILERLDNIEKALKEQGAKPMNFDEAATYLNVSKSHLYKLTSAALIPHYKPGGKMVYFAKPELDEWLLSKPVKTKTVINQLSDAYLMRKQG